MYWIRFGFLFVMLCVGSEAWPRNYGVDGDDDNEYVGLPLRMSSRRKGQAADGGGKFDEDGGEELDCDELSKIWRKLKMYKSFFSIFGVRGNKNGGKGANGLKKTTTTTAAPTASDTAKGRSGYGPRHSNGGVAGKPIYGRVVHSPDEYLYRSFPQMYRNLENVARMVGARNYFPTGKGPLPPMQPYLHLDYPLPRSLIPVKISHSGKFEELRNVLRQDRAKEEVRKMNENGMMVKGAVAQFRSHGPVRFDLSPPTTSTTTAFPTPIPQIAPEGEDYRDGYGFGEARESKAEDSKGWPMGSGY